MHCHHPPTFIEAVAVHPIIHTLVEINDQVRLFLYGRLPHVVHPLDERPHLFRDIQSRGLLQSFQEIGEFSSDLLTLDAGPSCYGFARCLFLVRV